MKEMYCEKTNYKRAYGVTEFAQLYFPGRTPMVAYQRCGNGYALRAG